MSEENKRNTDDELELERSLDEEIYEEDDIEEEITEDESILDEELPDEYYEDMLEEQWEEIQAMEAEKKAKDKERLEKIKAKRLARKKKERERQAKEAQKMSSHVYKEEMPQQPVVVPVVSVEDRTEEYINPQEEPYVQKPSQTEYTPGSQENSYGPTYDDYEARHQDDYRAEEYFKRLERERIEEAVRREKEENKYRPSSRTEEKVSENGSVNQQPEKQPTPAYVPVDSDVPNKGKSAETNYASSGDRQVPPEYNRDEVRDSLYESDYSRNHKMDAYNQRVEQTAEYTRQAASIESRQAQTKDSSYDHKIESVREEQVKERKSTFNINRNNVGEALYIGANNKVITEQERSFYAENGIPRSVMERVSPNADAKSLTATSFRRTIPENFQDSEFKREEVVGSSQGAVTKTEKASFRIRGNSDLQGHINNSSYTTTAVAVVKEYNEKVTSLKTDISIANQRIEKLKANPKLSDVQMTELKTLETMVAKRKDEIKLIDADKERVSEFLSNGARPFMKINKVDMLNSNYSKSHMMDVRTGKTLDDETAENIAMDSEKKKGILHSNDNLKLVHKNRLSHILSEYGGRFKRGSKNALKRVLREDEDIDKGIEMYDKADSVLDIIGRYSAHAQLKRELNRFGLSASSMSKRIKEIGVVVGVGDVSKMSLEKLNKLLKEDNLTDDARKKILEVIDLKTKLRMGPEKLADGLLKEAGEYLGYSKHQLKKMLKAEDLGFLKRGQIEKALEYKKLHKLNLKASGRWKAAKGFVGNLTEKLLRNNDYVSDALNLTNDAKTAYKIGRSATNIVKQAAKPAVSLAKRGASKAISGLRAKKEISGLATKAVSTEFAKQNAASGIGSRIKNLIGHGKASAAASGLKNGGRFAKTFSKIKNVAASIGKAIASFASSSSTLAAIGAAAAVIFIIAAFLFLGFILIASVYTIVLGDESANTDVTQLVEYLEEKNQEMLRQIDERVNGVPLTKDKKNSFMDEYTEVMYTYLDPNGNVCLVTNNTKELISMACVYFQQDLSDERAVKAFLDEMWEKSHEVTFTESGLYGCNGEVCLDEEYELNPSAKGYNGSVRYYDCGEDYTTDIKYLDCFPIQPERNLRISTDKLSYRFSNSVRYDSDYYGISDLRTENSTAGYGCLTKSSRWYCDHIESYGSQLQKLLVDASGKSYSRLVNDGGCEREHSGVRQGEPAPGCDDYDIVDHIEEDGEDIYFYLCDEFDCDGHTLTYHHCDMSHEEKVCDGHVDLSVNVCVLTFDELFDITLDEPREDFEGWNEDNVEWTKNIYEQDWKDLYDLDIPTSLFIEEDGIVSAITPSHPNSLPIILYNQLDYPNSPYGTSTVASSGCGVTCVAMLTTYYKDQEYSPAAIGRLYGQYYITGVGSSWGLFPGTAADLGLPYEKQTSSWADVVQALQDGKPVICSQNAGLFTSEGHFILLTGITEDGKILVNDPNGANYNKNQALKDGFANGFSQGQIQAAARSYWIYGAKQ